MAKNKTPGGTKGIVDRIGKSMDTLHTSTYFTGPENTKALDALRGKIDQNLDRIVNHNLDTMGIPSVSRLYSRMKLDIDRSNATGNASDVASLFDNALNYDDFFASFQSNRYLTEMDAEIDATCKYFPDLEEALSVLKEGVLSPDYFSKDFLTLSTSTKSDDKELFDERVKELKKKYQLLTLIEDTYYNASKYGEEFLYVVPYKIALSRLLTDKPSTQFANSVNVARESADMSLNETFNFNMANGSANFFSEKGHNPVFTESAMAPTMVSDGTAGGTAPAPIDVNYNLKVEICRKGIIESAVKSAKITNERRGFMESTASQFASGNPINEKGDLKIVKKDNKKGKLVIDGMENELGNSSDLAADGMIGYNNAGRKEVSVDVPGCVITKIKREQVIPIFVSDNKTCLGYYFMEVMINDDAVGTYSGLSAAMNDPLTSVNKSMGGPSIPSGGMLNLNQQDEMLRFVSGQLSNFIDKEFIQANQDLREEIYQILKYNDLFNSPNIDRLKVTFVPPEDMIHVYFKLDPNTHRGISDLDKSMIPAKIYASMYISDAIGKLVRGQDKRVYYVKQQVDSNISQTLMNVINQVKKGNFGFRQFSSINNVLNITGRFNDLFIPVSSSGDSPIQIETMPGQQFTDNSDQMQQLKEMAVNATGVPFEIVQTRLSVDYAMQLSMSNSKFLRKIYARQMLYTPFIERLVTKLYNFEYNEALDIEVTLPPPVFINTANTNQLVDNTKQFVQNVAEIELANEQDDAVKNEYQKKLFQMYIGTHIDLARHAEILEQAKQNIAIQNNASEEGGDNY